MSFLVFRTQTVLIYRMNFCFFFASITNTYYNFIKVSFASLPYIHNFSHISSEASVYESNSHLPGFI